MRTARRSAARRGDPIDAYLDPSVRVFPGLTGRPLINAEGWGVSINSGGVSGWTPATVLMATIHRLVDALRTDGHVKCGYVVVSSQPVELSDGSDFRLLVLWVEPNGPADAARVHFGDRIGFVDGSSVRDHEQIVAQLRDERIGQALKLTLLRAGEQVSVEVTIGERLRRHR